jgi:hypothetical protein
MNFCNKIRYNKDIDILCLHSDRMYDNLILGIHTMSIWFLALKTGCDTNACVMSAICYLVSFLTAKIFSINVTKQIRKTLVIFSK